MWKLSDENMMSGVGLRNRLGEVRVQQRPDQKLFVLIGPEDGIAGVESLIQAAERNAADQDTREFEEEMAAKAKLDAATGSVEKSK